ncbi:PA domain-containing protein [Asanoa hainanensis]|uniref:PA domain-containing protein n=1 Tax=Asanoa hainanensis TaxID=560556 RepID=A0A239P480_9ACTN|nr:S8 family peptidase [Asanoa hainanensis]SNT61109.1 PA domain-containing protein [Asanoa hainanensis]
MLGIPRAGRRRSAAALVAAATLSAFTLTSAPAQAAPPAAAAVDAPTQTYIVQTSDAPAATYNGGVAGLAPTRVAAGAKLDSASKNVKAYRQHLAQSKNRVLDRAGVNSSKVKYDYTLVFAGFSAELTAAEADRLKKTPGVANVWKNEIVHSETFTTPAFVGLDGKSGAWRKEFGSPERAGEGMIIGVIDSGFWPENPSFGPLPTPRKDQKTIDAKWNGTCVAGVERPVTCNNKVIGARWYASGNISRANPGEFDSPRDYYGHGSHTASTAGGNHNVTATINGAVAGVISGMAPAARLSIYKVLYANAAGTQSTGNSVDIVAAIDQAVADGVDVINYSIGDNNDGFGAVEFAFLNAANAGVFVATSAGNAGPGASTVDNGMPWTTTVAAGTHDRSSTKTLTLGNGQVFQGVGTGPAAVSAPVVDARTSGAAGSTELLAAQCVSTPPQLDPAKVAGKIVLCERGNNARVDKSLAVKNAGGVGMIQFNPTANTLNADYHAVPSIHVDQAAGAAVKAYIAAGGTPTATISAASNAKVRAPVVATFSSRGPGPSSGGDLIKPDIMAPGVDVVAATGPESHNGNLWDTNSGTSMASPHIAGIGALILAKHPNWSPMMVKSALMTTAGVVDNEGKPIQDESDASNANPLEMGAGQVAAKDAFDPGLVYDSGITQWLQYSCGIGVHLSSGGEDVCDSVGTVDPSDFNNPTLAVGDLAGKQTLTRTVTNVSKLPALYLPTVQAPPGFKVDVSPKLIALLPGRKQTFKVTITRTTGAFGEWSFGSLRWRDLLGHDVRSAIAVRPVPAAVPLEAGGSGASGQTALRVTAGYAGTLTAAGNGLQAATVDQWTLAVNQTATVTATVPAGTKLARFATFDADYPAGTDIDITVFRQNANGTLTQVGQSAGGTSEESVTVTEAGTYVAAVVLFAAAGPVDVKHHRWAVPAGNAGNLTVTPASQQVTLAGAATVTAAWSGLTPGQRYLGVLEYTDGTTTVGSTNLLVVA